MNGIHDMGGMHNMGPIEYEKNEPTFHADWEGRVTALNFAMQATRKVGPGPRRAVEMIPGPDYMRMSYYERWYVSLIERMVAAGVVTRAEIASGRPADGAAKSLPALSASEAPAFLAKAGSLRRNVPAIASFEPGQHVRARNINPATYTRLPRYARGKPGIIERDRGVFAFPDTVALQLGEKPQHLYSVRFAAQDLWGGGVTPQDAVYIDLWDDYLEPV